MSVADENNHLVGPNNNLSSDLIKIFDDQSDLVRVCAETSAAAIEVININGTVYTSFTRARNKDRLQILSWWRSSTQEGLGIAHFGKKAQGYFRDGILATILMRSTTGPPGHAHGGAIATILDDFCKTLKLP